MLLLTSAINLFLHKKIKYKVHPPYTYSLLSLSLLSPFQSVHINTTFKCTYLVTTDSVHNAYLYIITHHNKLSYVGQLNEPFTSPNSPKKCTFAVFWWRGYFQQVTCSSFDLGRFHCFSTGICGRTCHIQFRIIFPSQLKLGMETSESSASCSSSLSEVLEDSLPLLGICDAGRRKELSSC